MYTTEKWHLFKTIIFRVQPLDFGWFFPTKKKYSPIAWRTTFDSTKRSGRFSNTCNGDKKTHEKPSLRIQSPFQMVIGVYNHLLRKVFRFHYHSQKVIGSLGLDTLEINTTKHTQDEIVAKSPCNLGCSMNPHLTNSLYIYICIYMYIYIIQEVKWPLFWLERALFWRVDLQKERSLGLLVRI